MNLQDANVMQIEVENGAVHEPVAHRNHPGSVIARIEAVLETVIDKLANAEELNIPFSSRRRNSQASVGGQQIRFPGRSPLEARKFARVLLVLQLTHQALTSGAIFTKRHIYYQHQDLFETQKNVDEIVDDLAFTLRVGREDLNIVASAKGLFVGCLELRLQDGTILSGSAPDTAISIPMVRSITSLSVSQARWLLIVEKDAVFQSLASARFSEISTAGPGILVTAKGYPDLMTRSFLALISTYAPHLPMFVLTDYDPDGINIFATYRYGTRAFEHELVNGTVPMTWIGIKNHHLIDLEAAQAVGNAASANLLSVASPSTDQTQETLSPLTLRDRKYAVNILRKFCPCNASDDQVQSVCRELRASLLLGVKAEIQHVDTHGNLIKWLDEELKEAVSG